MAGFISIDATAGDIYKKGWIDFNKNGVKDVFEDPSAEVEKRVADLSVR
jgi:beta-glucosidase